MARLLLLNGPNLNLLGQREPAHYGIDTLADIMNRVTARGRDAGHEVLVFQSNAEHELIGQVQNARARGIEFLIINPAAYTHTSIALRDALLAVGLPFIEVHLSNIYARESFRHRSYLSDIAYGVICGLGGMGYILALEAAMDSLEHARHPS